MMSEERVLCLFSFYFFPEIWHKQQSTIDGYLLLSIRKCSPRGLSANRGSLLGVTTVGRLAKRWWATWSFGGCGWDEKGRGVCWSKPSVAGLYPSSGSALWPGAQRPGRWSTGNDDPYSYLGLEMRFPPGLHDIPLSGKADDLRDGPLSPLCGGKTQEYDCGVICLPTEAGCMLGLFSSLKRMWYRLWLCQGSLVNICPPASCFWP